MRALSDHFGLENCIEERRANEFVDHIWDLVLEGRESKHEVSGKKGLWKRARGSGQALSKGLANKLAWLASSQIWWRCSCRPLL